MRKIGTKACTITSIILILMIVFFLVDKEKTENFPLKKITIVDSDDIKLNGTKESLVNELKKMGFEFIPYKKVMNYKKYGDKQTTKYIILDSISKFNPNFVITQDNKNSYSFVLISPWYLKHKTLLIIIYFILLCLILILVINWIKQRKKEKRQTCQLKILEAIQNRLYLSIRSLQTTIWTYQNNFFKFNESALQFLPIKEIIQTPEGLKKIINPQDINEFNNMLIKLDSQYKNGNKEIYISQMRIKSKFSQKYIWIEWRFCYLNINNETITCGLLQNIEQAKQLEYELIKAKKLTEQTELKQSFLANMSHEIRTPLNAIVGYSNLLADSENDFSEEEKKNFIDIIQRNNNYLLKLINDVLELSRLESENLLFNMELYPANKIVEEVYQTHRVLINSYLNFSLELPENHKMENILIDRLRLTQVITNFLGNANKFTAKGFIKLCLKYNDETKEVIISVEDSGKGISKEEQELIFDRFYKSDESEQGTGLGLSISRVIMQKMNGRIEVDSEIGKGSKFSVILPYIK